MKITFWGATEDVTGSMTFVDLPKGKILVDCGLAQGNLKTKELNHEKLPFHPKEIKAVIVTHAHLDHSGYLPKLVKDGFKGPIYCTSATAKLIRIILRDAASLNEEELYSDDDVTATLHRVSPVSWNETISLLGGTFTLIPAGHILGASSVKIRSENKTILFSGDLGREDDPLIPAPAPAPEADVIVMESTYGSKNRKGDIQKDLHSFLMRVSRENIVGIIASFAVARGQLLLTMIHEFFERHPEARVRVIIDSPMMKEANQAYVSYSSLTKIPAELSETLKHVEVLDFQRQWESLKKKDGPLIIISSSGMLTGGRISRHMKNWCDDSTAAIFLPGYQAKGTPGRDLVEGKRYIKLGEEFIDWKGEIISSDAFSSHADQAELLNWLRYNKPETKVFLLHGETEAKEILAERIRGRGLEVTIPHRLMSFTI